MLAMFICIGMLSAFTLGICLTAALHRQTRSLPRVQQVHDRVPTRRRGTTHHHQEPKPIMDIREPDDFHKGLTADHVLVAAPVVNDPSLPEPVSLRDWLIHYTTHRDDAWPHVVGQFYAAAAHEPAIASYFGAVDMAALQRHFTAALMIVSHHGLTVGTVRRMQAAHRCVRDSAGEPITVEIYDAVISVLVGVLAREGVPFATITQLMATVLPLREVIAVRGIHG